MMTDELLREIRDLLAHRGAVDRTLPGTQPLGVETPLIMANVSSVQPTNLVGAGPNWTPIAGFDSHHYTQGEILVSIDSSPPASLGLFAYAAQVRVTGYASNIATILAVGTVNTASGPLLVPMSTTGLAWDKIGIEGRQLVNGVASDQVLPRAQLTASTQTRIYR